MADLSDVTAYIAQAAATAVYPDGTGQPSVAALDCRIYEGWPNPDKLDRDIQGKTDDNPPVQRENGPVAHVSIFPMHGTGVGIYQILDQTYTIAEPTFGMSFSLAGNTITVSGQPEDGEYLTLIVDDAVVCSQGGATTAALLAALAAEAQVKGYPNSSASSSTLTVPAGHSLVVRQGGIGKLGKVTHRQRQSIMVTVWAPDQASRATLAAAIDVRIKAKNKVTMPDTSQAIVVYSRTITLDEQEATGIYRRDLIYDVDYATVEEFIGYVITSTQVSPLSSDQSAIAIATI